MKRKQKYIVSVMHRATIDVAVQALNREDAKTKALFKFHSSAEIDSDFMNLDPVIHRVKCLGTAEKTKSRKQ